MTLHHAAQAHDFGLLQWRYFGAAAFAFSSGALRQVSLETHHAFGAIGYAEEHEARALRRAPDLLPLAVAQAPRTGACLLTMTLPRCRNTTWAKPATPSARGTRVAANPLERRAQRRSTAAFP
jgi:hypothetical protein